MNAQNPVICVGEVGIELARGGDGRFGLGFNGDTFNTAVYLARAGIPVAYATAMGDDPYSDGLVALAAAEGVRCDCVIRVAGRLPGLTVVDTARTGERQFYYWGETSPAHELFELPNGLVAEALVSARLIYFSGITLSLIPTSPSAAFSRHWSWHDDAVSRLPLTATFVRAGGREMSRARARYSWRRSSASISPCRPMRTKRCYGAIRARKRPWSGCARSQSGRLS